MALIDYLPTLNFTHTIYQQNERQRFAREPQQQDIISRDLLSLLVSSVFSIYSFSTAVADRLAEANL